MNQIFMKKLGLLGLFFSLLAAAGTIVNHFVYLPKREFITKKMKADLDTVEFDEIYIQIFDRMFIIALLVIIFGFLGAISSSYSLIKEKNKVAIIGIIIPFATIVLCLLDGKH